jgi:hypothetical protein
MAWQWFLDFSKDRYWKIISYNSWFTCSDALVRKFQDITTYSNNPSKLYNTHVTPCGLIGRCQHFRETYCLHLNCWSEGASVLKMEKVCFSNMLVSTYEPTWHNTTPLAFIKTQIPMSYQIQANLRHTEYMIFCRPIRAFKFTSFSLSFHSYLLLSFLWMLQLDKVWPSWDSKTINSPI